MANRNDKEKKYYYFTGIVMLIIISLEFILNIVFIGVAGNIKDSHKFSGNTQGYIAVFSFGELQNIYIRERKYYDQNEIFSTQYKAISAIFSLFFIAFIFYAISFVIVCKDKLNTKENYNSYIQIFLLIIYFICQFLYLMYCIIIPIYYQRVKKLLSERNIQKDYNNIVKDYRALTGVCYFFLFIILFFNFIVLNLYKKICCNMTKICLKTDDCFMNFLCFLTDKMAFICGKENKSEGIKNCENLGDERDKKINNLTVEISNLMAQNIEISIKNAKI